MRRWERRSVRAGHAWRRWGMAFVAGLLAVLAWETSGEAQDTADELAGKRLFRSSDWTATGLTCVHCHADFNEKKTPDQYVRPGQSLYNSGFRSQWQDWEGRPIYKLELAIETCMRRWMTTRTDSLEGEDAAGHRVRQLSAYLRTEELSPERKSKPIEPMRADTVPGDRVLRAGDPVLGAIIFRRSCAICHANEGNGPAPSLVRNGYSRYQIAKKVRGVDNKGLRGVAMPPFPRDRLSDRELLNVVAYVYQM